MKQPYPFSAGDSLDFVWDWTAWLAKEGDEILSYEIDPPAGVEVTDRPLNGGVISAFLSVPLGTAPGTYRVPCVITTDSTPPRICTRSIVLLVDDR